MCIRDRPCDVSPRHFLSMTSHDITTSGQLILSHFMAQEPPITLLQPLNHTDVYRCTAAGHADSLACLELDRCSLCQRDGLVETARKADNIADICYEYRLNLTFFEVATPAEACGSAESMQRSIGETPYYHLLGGNHGLHSEGFRLL